MPRSLGFQVPFAERVRKEADIATMAVGIILEAQQAEAILEKGQADLIAVGRQSQYNPNIAHHWAHDLGINRRFEDWSPEYGWWLEKRIKTLEGFAMPTGAVIRPLVYGPRQSAPRQFPASICCRARWKNSSIFWVTTSSETPFGARSFDTLRKVPSLLWLSKFAVTSSFA